MKVTIVPCDSTILVDGKHCSHHDIKSLKLRDKTETVRPKFCIHAVHYDSDENGDYAVIEWQKPKNTIISKAQFDEMFGHCVEEHKAHFEKLEKERLEWEARDKVMTEKIKAVKTTKE